MLKLVFDFTVMSSVQDNPKNCLSICYNIIAVNYVFALRDSKAKTHRTHALGKTT